MYTSNEIALIWLDTFSLGHKKNASLMSIFPRADEILKNFANKRSQLIEVLGETIFENMKKSINESYISKCLMKLEKYGVVAITRESEKFPGSLIEIANPPLVIYTKGDVSLLSRDRKIAIVGTRKPTRYGRDMANWFSEILSKNDFVTVSGLAFGVDSEVAKKTLDCGGRHIAVLGGGLDSIYPAQNVGLAERILENGGLLVSEYRPNVLPTTYSFPERNRIISGLSSATLIIEAGEKSGSLITATFAIEQNKDLFVVPSNLNSYQGRGSNALINEIPHAFVTSPEDILKFFGVEKSDVKVTSDVQLSIEEQVIFDVLAEDDLCFDEILEKTNLDAKTLNSLLTRMEISGIIKKLSGNYFGIN